jgi:L-ascorbate metabolism protein UlaG (beta-lactamase superfamily)
MRLIKYTHACVRLERSDAALVIDPGAFSEREAYDGASAVLITHEHRDHVDFDLLPSIVKQNPELKIYAAQSVADQLAAVGDNVITVSVGETFTAAGFTVQAVGGEHAEICDGKPGIANLGYIVDGAVYHPGDAFFVPSVSVPTLLLPVSAPWLKTAEAVAFVRAMQPQRAIPIHDVLLSEIGMQLTDTITSSFLQTSYERIPVGSATEV